MAPFKRIVCFAIAVLIPALAVAQGFEISGKVVDRKLGAPIFGASVVLKNSKNGGRSIAAVTNDEGMFRFDGVRPGSYSVQISFVSYKPVALFIDQLEKSYEFGAIEMEEDLKVLEEVKVMGEAERLEVKGDTVEYNSEAYKTMSDASVEDLVQKMPGVSMNNGKLEAQGEEVKQVLVDGKRFFGNDVNLAMRNLPSEVVDKIQVFDQLSEQAQLTGFDDGERQKTINIITKPGARNSLFGKASAGLGNDDRYMGSGVLNVMNGDQRLSVLAQSNNINIQNFSSEDLLGVTSTGGARARPGGGGRRPDGGGGPGGGGSSSTDNFLVGTQSGISSTDAIGLNYQDSFGEKLEVTGSYFYNKTDNSQNQSTNQVYNVEGSPTYSEQQLNTTENGNHRLNLRLTYDINQNNSLLFLPSISTQANKSVSDVQGILTDGTQAVSGSSSAQTSDIEGYSGNGNLIWRHKFDKRGRTFSWNVGLSANNRSGNTSLLGVTSNYTLTDETDSLDQRADISSPGHEVSSRLIYTEPVSENGMVSLEYNISRKVTDSEKYTYNIADAGYAALDTALSSLLSSQYSAQRFGGGYRYRNGPISVLGNVTYQYAQLNNQTTFPYEYFLNSDYRNVLGMFHFNYRSAGKNLMAVYRTSTSIPSVSQLQNVVDNSNPLQLSAGNEQLSQQYQHNFTARFTTGLRENTGTLMAFLGGTIADNYITNSTYIADRDTLIGDVLLVAGGQFIKPVNLDGYKNIRSLITYGIPVSFLKSNLNFNISGSVTKTPGLVNSALNMVTSNALGLGLVLSSNISRSLDFTVSSTSTFTGVENQLQVGQSQDYFFQSTRLNFNWLLPTDIIFRTDVTHQLYSGLSEGYDQNFALWNLSIGKKLFKDKRGELSLFAYDLLKQNNSISRNVTDAYVEDVQTEVLQRYFMAKFTYNFWKKPGVGS
ncbi:MAG: TonB-dependent receptor [Imperialibacter sp.]|uniref:TonB-dependent receptor n=1 Tax=Imperialibacter sp. TaxID=2038411 RepID=UPI0032F04330